MFESENEDELVRAILEFKIGDKSKLKEMSAAVFGYDAISAQVLTAYKEGLRRIESTRNRA